MPIRSVKNHSVSSGLGVRSSTCPSWATSRIGSSGEPEPFVAIASSCWSGARRPSTSGGGDALDLDVHPWAGRAGVHGGPGRETRAVGEELAIDRIEGGEVLDVAEVAIALQNPVLAGSGRLHDRDEVAQDHARLLLEVVGHDLVPLRVERTLPR